MSLPVEFVRFVWKERRFWLIPFVLVLLLLALVAIVAQSPVAPFLYPF